MDNSIVMLQWKPRRF